jgi:RNA polymerase sigma factor (sigma-70 family)
MAVERDVEHTDEASLIVAARSGDPVAFEVLYRRYRNLVYAIAYSYVLNAADAADVAQEAFMNAYRRIRSLKAPDSFAAWLTRIAVNCNTNFRRQRRREISTDTSLLLQDAFVLDDVAGNVERCELVRIALSHLDVSYRQAVLLRFMQGATIDEIAKSLMITPSAAEMRVRRALSQMRRFFEGRDSEHDVCAALRTHCLAVVSSACVLDRVHEQLMKSPPPAAPKGAMAGLLPSAATGTLIVGAIVALVGAPYQETQGVVVGETIAPVERTMSVVVEKPKPAFVQTAFESATTPPVETIVVPMATSTYPAGAPIPGWTSGVYASSEPAPPGVPGNAYIVNTNIPSAFYRFPLTRGIVTVSVWLKPKLGDDTNFGLRIGNDVSGWVPNEGSATVANVVVKDENDQWFAPMTVSRSRIRLGRYDGEWHHVVVRYDTAKNEYDLSMDDEWKVRSSPTTIDLSAGISLVAMDSGRWHRELDSESLFAGLTVTATRTDTPLPQVVHNPAWSKPYPRPVLPVTPGDFDAARISGGRMLFVDGLYRMWYLAHAGGITGNRVGYATSRDGIRWTKHGVVFERGIGWEQSNLHSLSVLREDGVYKMWYSAGTRYGNSGAVGYATSPDGVVWTRYEGNPVVPEDAIADLAEFYVGQVLRVGDQYRMWLCALRDEDDSNVFVSLVSDDGIRWTSEGVCFKPERSADEHYIASPFVTLNDGLYEMWYRSSTYLNRTRVRRAISHDGVHWERDLKVALDAGAPGEWDYPYALEIVATERARGRTRVWYRAGGTIIQLGYAELRDVAMSATSASAAAASRIGADTKLRFRLLPNYPNPFNPETWIPFELDATSRVTVNIYGSRGERVRRLDLGVREAGRYVDRANAAYWDGRNEQGEPVASGVYHYEIRTDKASATRAMVIRK